jgi:hypothetical protein
MIDTYSQRTTDLAGWHTYISQSTKAAFITPRTTGASAPTVTGAKGAVFSQADRNNQSDWLPPTDGYTLGSRRKQQVLVED